MATSNVTTSATTLTNTLNRVQFIAEDFVTYRSEANQFFQMNYPTTYNNLIATDLGNALMDQLAFAMQALSFMMNRRASENFFSTAKLNSSVVKIAKMLGYPIQPASPATCDLTITFHNAPYNFPVTLSPGFQFQGPGNIIFEYADLVNQVLSPGQTEMTLPVREGMTNRISFISSGLPNQSFNIFGIPSGQFLYQDGILLTVDGVEWDFVSLLKYESSPIFEVLFTNNPPVLNFGDGIVGNIPPAGSSIVLSYRYGQGLSGAVGQNLISSPVTPLVIQGQTIPMSLSNTDCDVGSNPEDIRHVKAYASSYFRTQNAAVIKSDYDTIAQLQSGVALADAEIIRGISQDLVLTQFLNTLTQSSSLMVDVAQSMIHVGVSGLSSLGVSGQDQLSIQGLQNLNVGNTQNLGVSGTEFLGTDGSGNVTGVNYLGVSGVTGLQVIGQEGILISGISNLGVSGTQIIGISGQSDYTSQAVSGSQLIETSVSGLSQYLSQTLSDTSKANQVQVVLLGIDSNNKYISPSTSVIQNVKTTLQNLADAVVTVNVVDGSSNIVPVDLLIELGISLTAVQSQVESQVMQALTSTVQPLGLLVKRTPGMNLYKSDIQTAILNATASGDIAYMNITIQNPTSLLDDADNLIIGSQQVIQNNNMTIKTIQRVTSATTY